MDAWVLGATGRFGRAIVSELAGTGVTPVPVGRDAGRLAAAFPDADRTVTAGSLGEMAAAIRAQRPAVVVNTVGPFAATADVIARACLPASHYLDLANDVWAFSAVFDLHERAVEAGRTLVPGAAFGVVATEGVLTALCAGHPTPERVRVDVVPSLAAEDGVIGQALAASIVDGLPERSRRYIGGHPQRVPAGHDTLTLVLPDGTPVTTGGLPLGDLVAARRTSGAPAVVAASSLAPTGIAGRALVRVASSVLALDPLRRFARDRLAAVRTRARDRPREHSYGHARVEWADGTVREGWLRAGDAGTFTTSTAAVVADWLADGRGRPGAHTPVAALGADLVTAAGAELHPH
jgi:short subunit dehydrogenase-like uncharacterized protein